MEGMRTLGDIARFHARHRPDHVALRLGERSMTYAELDRESNRVAHALLSAGVGEGDRVAFLEKNGLEYFLVLLGASKVNAVTVSMNWRLAANEIEFIIDDSQAKVLVVGSEFAPMMSELRLPSVEERVVVDLVEGESTSFDSWVSRASPVDPQLEPGESDTCFQLYTSGTTGLPKGVELTNRGYFAQTAIAKRDWRISERSRVLIAMPLFHIAGAGWGVAGLYSGAENVIHREVDPSALIDELDAGGATHALLIPAVLQMLCAIPAAKEAAFERLEVITYGGSAISEPVLRACLETFDCDFFQVYGLTETTGPVTTLGPDDHVADASNRRLSSAGVPWGDMELRIVDSETGKDVAPGAVGEVWCRSVQVMKGYWGRPDATKEACPEDAAEDGRKWFRTGDAGYVEDGYLYICDRIKDMIISGGENIYPNEVEDVLMAHPDISDIAVIGVPDPKWGETVKALVCVRSGSDPSEDDIIAFARERLAAFKCPRSVDRLDVLPRNPSGKILKTELRKPYWQDRAKQVN